MDPLNENLSPGKGFVRRLASSFSSKINTNDKTKPTFIKNSPLRSSLNSDVPKNIRNNLEISSINPSRNPRSSVADIKRLLETNNNNKQAIQKLCEQNGSKTSKPDLTHYQVEETLNGVQIQIKQPHLISVLRNQHEPKSNKTSIRIYPLKMGRTTIGSAATNDIVLKGAGVELDHCYIENSLRSCFKRQPGCSTSKRRTGKLVNLVVFYPIAQCNAIDGVLVDEPYILSSGSMICLGESDYFRYNHPNEELIEDDDTNSTTELGDIIISNSESTAGSYSTGSFKSLNLPSGDTTANDFSEVSEFQEAKNTLDNIKIQPAIKNVQNQAKTSNSKEKASKDKRTVRFNLPVSSEDTDKSLSSSDFLISNQKQRQTGHLRRESTKSQALDKKYSPHSCSYLIKSPNVLFQHTTDTSGREIDPHNCFWNENYISGEQMDLISSLAATRRFNTHRTHTPARKQVWIDGYGLIRFD